MELRVLQYFLAVAREQSVSGAAEYLHLSQPTLSRQLKDLEEELGKQLFLRGNRKITLTEEGMILRKRAEEIVNLVQKAEREITLNDEAIAGDIHREKQMPFATLQGQPAKYSRSTHKSVFISPVGIPRMLRRSWTRD